MIRTLAAVVPVADEQASLPDCLTALQRSRSEFERRFHRAVRLRTVVVLDGCTDGSAEIAAVAGVETVVISARRVGAARRAGAAHVLRTAGPAESVWLANTDADSQVPVDWLAGMLELADEGADLVLGTVRPDSDLPGTTLTAWYDAHVLADGHPHVHGANLGIRASAYEALGGWPDRTFGEDELLVARAAAQPGLSIARTARFPVSTSTRLRARTPYGFSSYLRGLVGEQCS